MTFRDYIRLNLLIIVQKRDRKTDRNKTPPDIIFKAVRAVKLHILFIRQDNSEFNMNYCTLSRYCKKIILKKIIYTRILLFQQFK